MKISSLQVQSLLKIYGRPENRTKVLRGDAGPAKSDNVTISDEGRLKQKAIQALGQKDDIRKDKIDEIKQAMASGTYQVNPEKVAEQIIYGSIFDKLV
ncbi:MAG: flagellar biosynthesis anti-sigma factor FlgM [Syntrophomonadaceae bacterium]|nr:flagellar biosynthesis anti-sigma factor FlgM [Syntrophomonadaceae bacterium]